VLHRLLARADVFVQNLVPRAMDRLDLNSLTLASRYPRLIVCNISGYGPAGPYSDRKAYDLLIQSESGLLSITGHDHYPAKVGVSIADIAAGVYAYSGILAAVLARSRTDSGMILDVSLLDALGEWMGYAIYYTAFGGTQPARTGAAHASIAPYGPFRTADGSEVYVAVQNESEWRRFCQIVLQQPQLAGDERFRSNSDRVRNRAALQPYVERVCSGLSRNELLRRLEQASVAYGRMNSVDEFIRHPQLSARNRWRSVESPVGTLPALLPPVTMQRVEPVMGPIPGLGEHTDAILGELGICPEQIAEWRRHGIV